MNKIISTFKQFSSGKITLSNARKAAGLLQNWVDKRVLYNSSLIRRREDSILSFYVKTGVPNAMNFDFKQLKAKTLRYVRIMKMDNREFLYRFSASTKSHLLYASVYACMIRSLYG